MRWRRNEQGQGFGCVGCGGSLLASLILTLLLNFAIRACN